MDCILRLCRLAAPQALAAAYHGPFNHDTTHRRISLAQGPLRAAVIACIATRHAGRRESRWPTVSRSIRKLSIRSKLRIVLTG